MQHRIDRARIQKMDGARVSPVKGIVKLAAIGSIGATGVGDELNAHAVCTGYVQDRRAAATDHPAIDHAVADDCGRHVTRHVPAILHYR